MTFSPRTAYLYFSVQTGWLALYDRGSKLMNGRIRFNAGVRTGTIYVGIVGNLIPTLNGTTSPVSRYPSSAEAPPPIVNPAQQELAPVPPPSTSFQTARWYSYAAFLIITSPVPVPFATLLVRMEGADGPGQTQRRSLFLPHPGAPGAHTASQGPIQLTSIRRRSSCIRQYWVPTPTTIPVPFRTTVPTPNPTKTTTNIHRQRTRWLIHPYLSYIVTSYEFLKSNAISSITLRWV
ncbi:hypothetical protein BDN72DRAFT_859857 [Pluteus cervinus]|uniref:Uncharacterized protein n=1 Tax=Pluteus cervinus TaxID=181527 RepID=A0ACD3AKU6_9AGAR|nr:hypothetical protein BDN72DRAFT_859857 [Pluteus cervinus]